MASLVIQTSQSPSPSCRKRGFSSTLNTLLDPSIPLCKRLRCSEKLNLSLDFDQQLLERVFEASKSDLNSSNENLNTLNSAHVEKDLDVFGVSPTRMQANAQLTGQVTETAKERIENELPTSCADWIDLIVSEMTKASNLDDVRLRVSNVIEMLEKSIRSRASNETAQLHNRETEMLQQKMEDLLHDNAILKRAVVILHERQKDYDARNQELQQMKQMVSHYEDRLRTLEASNYTLSVHLRQALQANPIPGRINPDVF